VNPQVFYDKIVIETPENGLVNHVEIKLSREELKIIIEKFLKEIVTCLPVEY
jgi:hypothetical protein